MRANQAAAGDFRWHRRPARLLTAIAPVLGAGVLFDGQGRLLDIDLLDDAWMGRVEPQGSAAAGAGVECVGLKPGDLLGGEGLACVLVVAGLAADGTLLPSDLSGGLGLTMSEEGGFDEVSEFFLAAANWARTRSSSASSAATLV